MLAETILTNTNGYTSIFSNQVIRETNGSFIYYRYWFCILLQVIKYPEIGIGDIF